MGKFALAAILSFTLLANPGWVGASPGVGRLFGTNANGGQLLTVNTGNGAGTVVGLMGAGVVPALAVDPITGILYAGQGAGLPNLYTVNKTTGAATLVGNTGLGFAAIADMDFRSDGTLFAAVNIVGDGGTGAETLATINKSTGVATVIGPFGTEGMEAIAFDGTGQLWGAHSARGAGTPGLYLINTATGAATFQRPIVDGAGKPPSGGVVGMRFVCAGLLYGGTARAVGSATDGGRLIFLDPLSGVFSFVGAGSATGGSSLAALAFDTMCPAGNAIPTLSEWMMIIMATLLAGLGIHAIWRRRTGAQFRERLS